MTGNKAAPPAPNYWGLGGLFLLLAAPAFAQMPNGADTSPNAPPPPAITAPDADETPSTLPALLEPPSLVIDSALSGPLNRPHAQPFDAAYGGEVTFHADQADGDLKTKRYTLTGNVRLHETDMTIRADEVTFNGQSQNAVAFNSVFSRKVFTIRSARLEGTPELLTATDADFTTVPPGEKADYHLHAQTITFDGKSHRGVLRNATLYLFGARLLTIPRLTFHAGGPATAKRQTVMPAFGASARYGTFLALGSSLQVGRAPVQYRLLLPTRQSLEAAVTSQQILYRPSAPHLSPKPYLGPVTLLDRIRTLATVPPGPLPEGDPLRFRDFLPEPNPINLFSTPSRGGLELAEDLSIHIAASGHLRDDLYVSRLPEIILHGQVPVTRLPAQPAYGDPRAFRAALRHLVFYLDAQETVGEYREQPTNIIARRVRTQIGFSAYPLLVAPNTVLQPRLSISSSGYSGTKSAYRYDQLDVAVNHYFSDLTAVGVQFLAGNTGGDSPFNFDVLDTSREVDLRVQLGNRHLITAGRLRYDLSHHGVIDYQLAVAPGLGGFTPIFSYNFRTRSFGLGVEIKGITF